MKLNTRIGILAWNCLMLPLSHARKDLTQENGMHKSRLDRRHLQAIGAVETDCGTKLMVQRNLYRQDQISREFVIDKNGATRPDKAVSLGNSGLTREPRQQRANPYMVRPFGYDIGLSNLAGYYVILIPFVTVPADDRSRLLELVVWDGSGSVLIGLCRDDRVVKQLEEIVVVKLGSHMTVCVIIWSPILFEKKKDKLMCMYIDYGESDILETRLNMRYIVPDTGVTSLS
ncbi:hypothetical protein L2E82_44938 [Cichorium intybus]|uniref:Uncharacterized protein n=1 Tax=Cichorium intybus TaxID=13427 RepID=A0ACB8ZQL8_CICIN|nr:hypothetical protein L2E82_44938 [Cichorium intybus]